MQLLSRRRSGPRVHEFPRVCLLEDYEGGPQRLESHNDWLRLLVCIMVAYSALTGQIMNCEDGYYFLPSDVCREFGTWGRLGSCPSASLNPCKFGDLVVGSLDKLIGHRTRLVGS